VRLQRPWTYALVSDFDETSSSSRGCGDYHHQNSRNDSCSILWAVYASDTFQGYDKSRISAQTVVVALHRSRSFVTEASDTSFAEY